jgi:hypothetical protein
MAKLNFQLVNATGAVVGGFTTAVGTDLHGWMLYNSGASAYTVSLYTANPVTQGSPAAPSASGLLVATIELPAATSKEYFEDAGVYFKDGLFVVASNASVTGSIIYG